MKTYSATSHTPTHESSFHELWQAEILQLQQSIPICCSNYCQTPPLPIFRPPLFCKHIVTELKKQNTSHGTGSIETKEFPKVLSLKGTEDSAGGPEGVQRGVCLCVYGWTKRRARVVYQRSRRWHNPNGSKLANSCTVYTRQLWGQRPECAVSWSQGVG